MSSALPTREGNYQWPSAPARAVFDRAASNFLLGDVAARLNALEDIGTGIEQLQAELQNFGIQRLDEAILPLINQTVAQIADLQQQVSDTATANAAIIEDFQEVTAVNLEEVAEAVASAISAIDSVRDEIDLMLAGGLAADKVAESSTQVFLTPEQRAEIGALRIALTALSASIAALTFADYRPWVAVNANANGLPWQRIKAAAGITITLPLVATAVADGALVDIWPVGLGQTINGNGRLIEGYATITIDQPGVGLTLAHDAGAWRIQRWSIINNG